MRREGSDNVRDVRTRRVLLLGAALGICAVFAGCLALVALGTRRIQQIRSDMQPLGPPPAHEYARAVAACEEYLRAWKKADYAEEYRLMSVWGPCRVGPPGPEQLKRYSLLRQRYKASPEVRRLTWLDPSATTSVKPRPDLLDKPELYWRTLFCIAMANGPEDKVEQQWKVWRQAGVAPVEVTFPNGKLIMVLVREGGDWRAVTTPEQAWDDELLIRGF